MLRPSQVLSCRYREPPRALTPGAWSNLLRRFDVSDATSSNESPQGPNPSGSGRGEQRLIGANRGDLILAGTHYRVDENGCWRWLGHVSRYGYGVWGGAHKVWGTDFAHRIVWLQQRGPIPQGLVLDHKCRVRDCVNPDHLRICTVKENNHFMFKEWGGPFVHHNTLKTHCPHGHEYTPENTYVLKSGSRACRTCALERARDHKRIARAKTGGSA